MLRDRVRSYFQASRPTELHKSRMVEEIADLDLVVTDSEMEALALENNLIKRHKPPYNLRLRDDKNHPYLKLTLAEEYPRLYVVRRPSEDGNAYGGPYIPASLGRKTAGLVKKLFGIRSCKETLDGQRPRPCLQYQIKRCAAPCVEELCSLERYRRSCEDARLFLEGRTEEVAKRLRGQMEEAAGGERFEEAASLRDQVRALLRMEAPQKITTTDIEERDLFAAHVEGDRAAVQVFSVRDGKVVAREGFLLDRLTEPEAVARLDPAAVLRRGALRAPRGRGAGGDPGPASSWRRGSPPGAGPSSASTCPSAGRSCACSSSSCATRGWPSSWSGSTRASSRRRSCARCRTSSTSRSSRSASSASTSRTSRGRTSWPRWSSSRRACRRRPTTASSA